MNMKTTIKHTDANWKPAFAPWRFIPGAGEDSNEVWTAFDGTPGARNNYAVATGIQDSREGALIATAPELLAALVNLPDSVFSHLESIGCDGNALEIRAAIAKATGGQQ
jgi:hypothetical protein